VLANKPSTSYSVKEINWLLNNANGYGYELIGNSWVKITP
jgi:hypothetical protein